MKTVVNGPAGEETGAASVLEGLTANFEVTVYEVVASPEDDGLSYTKMYANNEFIGQVPSGLKSHKKKCQTVFPEGNHLLRFERWVLPWLAGEWEKIDSQWQPRERFVKVEEGMKTRVLIKYYAKGKRYSYAIERIPLGEGR